MEEETRYCDCCGSELEDDEGIWADDELVCQNCFDENYGFSLFSVGNTL